MRPFTYEALPASWEGLTTYPTPKRTVVLPHVTAFNESALPQVMKRVVHALGARSAATGIYDLARDIGAPTALKDIGMKEEDIDEAVGLVLGVVRPEDNPRPIDEAVVRNILEGAYASRRPGSVVERRI